MRTAIRLTIPLLPVILSAFLSSAAFAQTTVSTGQGYANDVYYDFDKGIVRTEPAGNWDIGFQIQGYASSIITNGSAGVQLYEVPGKTIDNWSGALDTAGLATSWKLWHNAPESWEMGAFNMGNDYNTGNFGWGEYDMNTHIVAGTALYVIVLPNGVAKKIVIDGLSGGTYNFRYADLDGSNEMTAAVSKSGFTGKNFGYYSLRENKSVDREPLNSEWDLVFGKYIEILQPMMVPYPVTGVRLNLGVEAARVTSGTPATVAAPDASVYSQNINTIGYDWKSFTGSEYKLSDSLAFFVKTPDDMIHRIVFTGFGGSATGDFVFNQESVSAASVRDEEGGVTTAAIYPSVTSRGSMVDVVYSLDHAVTGARAVVHNVSGQVLSTSDLDGGAGMHRVAIAAPDASGFYFVTIECGARRLSQRLIVR